MGPLKTAQAARYYRARGRDDIARHLEAELNRAGRCRICGRRLTDPASVGVGIGPDCAQRQPAPAPDTQP